MARTRNFVAIAVGALLAACKPAPPPSVDDLAYPVVVAWESSGIVRHDDAKDLQVMSTQRVVNANSAPFLVDSQLDVYRLDRLASTHGGMWLMANPVGRTDVTFELVRVAQGDAARARALIARRTWEIREGNDSAAAKRLATANTLAEMLAAIGK